MMEYIVHISATGRLHAKLEHQLSAHINTHAGGT